MNAAEQWIQQLKDLGFSVASRSYPGENGIPHRHCSRDVNTVDADFGFNLQTGELHRWGTSDTWTPAEWQAEFGTGTPETATGSATGSADVAADSSPPSTATRDPATPDPATLPRGDAESIFRDAGFLFLKISEGLEGRPPKFWAQRSDGSRWLLDPETGKHSCISDRPISTWTLQRGRLVSEHGTIRTDDSKPETPRQTPKPATSPRGATPDPVQATPRRKQSTLF